MRLTPDQSHYVLTALLAQGRLRQSQVDSTLKGRQQEIARLRAQLANLEALDRGARTSRPRGRRAATRRRPKMSPRVRALRRLQGKYMGFVRRLKPAQKARIRVIREKQGLPAAIKAASSLASRAS